jgi:hypothetical protein
MTIASFWHAKFFSPKDLVCRAAIIAVIYAMVNVAGLREYTSILNGTVGSTEISRGLAAFLGVGYVCAYLAFVLLVPVFLIAAGLVAAWEKWRREHSPTGGGKRARDASG